MAVAVVLGLRPAWVLQLVSGLDLNFGRWAIISSILLKDKTRYIRDIPL